MSCWLSILIYVLNKENGTCCTTQYFIGLPKTEITIVVKDRIYREQFSGLMLMYLIEGLARKTETN